MTPRVLPDDGSHVIVGYSSYYNNKHFEFNVTRAQLEAAPAWTETEPNPPLPAKQALSIATDYLSRLVVEAERWRLRRLCLHPVGRPGFWVYIAEFSGFHPPGIGDGIVPNMNIVVLMNGKVIEPVTTEQRFR